MPADLWRGEESREYKLKHDWRRYAEILTHLKGSRLENCIPDNVNNTLCGTKAIIWERKGWTERPTCQGEYNENSEHVRVLCQYTRGFHGHVLSAEMLYVLPYQLIEGSAPRTGHTGRTWDGERPDEVDLVVSIKLLGQRKRHYTIVEHAYQWCRKGWGSIRWWRPRFPLQSHRSKDKLSLF